VLCCDDITGALYGVLREGGSVDMLALRMHEYVNGGLEHFPPVCRDATISARFCPGRTVHDCDHGFLPCLQGYSEDAEC
jgi:hypothetical protein